MCGKPFIKNLRWYLEDNLDTSLPITVFDTNIEQESPFISVGFVSDELHDTMTLGHYTVTGYIVTAMNGHDYNDADIDDVEESIIDSIALSSFSTEMNSSSSRPSERVHLNGFFILGTEREVDGDSTTVSMINFEAHCAAR